MGTGDDQKLWMMLGSIEEGVHALQRDAHEQRLWREDISVKGCVVGSQNAARLTALERKNGNGNGNGAGKLPMKQIILWASGAGAFISGLVAGLKAIVGP